MAPRTSQAQDRAPTSEEGDVRGAGGEQAAQEPEELFHQPLHVLAPLGLVPRGQHCLQEVQGQDLCGDQRAALEKTLPDTQVRILFSLHRLSLSRD